MASWLSTLWITGLHRERAVQKVPDYTQRLTEVMLVLKRQTDRRRETEE
jgi:hypothetical protein